VNGSRKKERKLFWHQHPQKGAGKRKENTKKARITAGAIIHLPSLSGASSARSGIDESSRPGIKERRAGNMHGMWNGRTEQTDEHQTGSRLALWVPSHVQGKSAV